MTEKEFSYRGRYIKLNNKLFAIAQTINDAELISKTLNQLYDENEWLKRELFETKKDYLIETYSDNPTRRDEKIQLLKEEFTERFGDSE